MPKIQLRDPTISHWYCLLSSGSCTVFISRLDVGEFPLHISIVLWQCLSALDAIAIVVWIRMQCVQRLACQGDNDAEWEMRYVCHQPSLFKILELHTHELILRLLEGPDTASHGILIDDESLFTNDHGCYLTITSCLLLQPWQTLCALTNRPLSNVHYSLRSKVAYVLDLYVHCW